MTDASLPPSPLTWAYADEWAEEPPEVAEARRRAREMGAPVPSRAVGALLRSLVAATRAQSVVEVGSGTGVTGGWILAGLPAEGALTTVDPDSALQTAARDTFTRMGVSHTRVRTIAGAPRQVLPRLSDGAYDVVVIGPGTEADGREDGDVSPPEGTAPGRGHDPMVPSRTSRGRLRPTGALPADRRGPRLPT